MEKIFTKGLYPSQAHQKTPWIVARLGIKKDQFIAWLNEQTPSEAGYIDIDICRSQKDDTKLYGSLNTYKAKKDPYEGYTSPDENGKRIKIDDIGF